MSINSFYDDDFDISNPDRARWFLYLTRTYDGDKPLPPDIRLKRNEAIALVSTSHIKDVRHRANQHVAHCFSRGWDSRDIPWRLDTIAELYDISSEKQEAIRLARVLCERIAMTVQDVMGKVGPESVLMPLLEACESELS